MEEHSSKMGEHSVTPARGESTHHSSKRGEQSVTPATGESSQSLQKQGRAVSHSSNRGEQSVREDGSTEHPVSAVWLPSAFCD